MNDKKNKRELHGNLNNVSDSSSKASNHYLVDSSKFKIPSKEIGNGQNINNLPHKFQLSNSKNLGNHTPKKTASNSQALKYISQCQGKSSEHLPGLHDQDYVVDIEQISNHKFYGCKKKGYCSPYTESFGLPDNPIFSNSPIFSERRKRSPLDTDLADPSDISVLDLKHIDQPWLVEYPEVITPYWDVESLFPFDDIRKKLEPDFSKQRNCDNINISNEVLDITVDSDSDNVFTSTPMKSQNDNLSLVSTINISDGENKRVDISILKDEVLKALEEAIKKDNVGNINMKIKIVASSPVKNNANEQSQKHSRGITSNDRIETNSSSCSSKENYLIVENCTEKLSNSLGYEDCRSQNTFNISQSENKKQVERSQITSPSKKGRRPVVRRNLRSSNLSLILSDKEHLQDKVTTTYSKDAFKSISFNVTSEISKNSKYSVSRKSDSELFNKRVLSSDIQVNQIDDNKGFIEKPKRRGRPPKVQSNGINQSDKEKTSIKVLTPLSKRILRSNRQELDLTNTLDQRGLSISTNNDFNKSDNHEKEQNLSLKETSDSNNFSPRQKVLHSTKSKKNDMKFSHSLRLDSGAVLDILKDTGMHYNSTHKFEQSKKSEMGSSLRSVLKNVYNSQGKLIGVQVQEEKHVKMDRVKQIKVEDDLDSTPLVYRLENLNKLQNEFEVSTIKTEEKEDNEDSILSSIKLVINPLEIKKEDQPVKKRGRPRKNNSLSTVDSKLNFEVKDIKIENHTYGSGDFVWAQVAKYPYWPAVICPDPETQKICNDVIRVNKPIITYYHIRFFGDNGRRAWINRKHIMLYCSKHDLEMIAKKLKSENKSYNVVKPYLVSHIIEKWRKAVEELESVKHKNHEEVHHYLLKCWEDCQILRRQRKENRKLLAELNSASESESEESDIHQKRKYTKFTDTSTGNYNDQGSISKYLRTSENIDVKTFRKSLKDCDELNITLNSPQNVQLVTNYVHRFQGTKYLKDIACDYSQNSVSSKIRSRRSQRASLDYFQQENTVEGKDKEDVERKSFMSFKEKGTKKHSKSKVEDLDEESLLSRIKKKQLDDSLETGSKTSSDASNGETKLYSFEYQLELHRKNHLFNGLRNIKVCEYCFKQGDLYKCKGKCGYYYHLECASKVTEPKREDRKNRKKDQNTKIANRGFNTKIDSSMKIISNSREKKRNDLKQDQVQIITIRSRRAISSPKKVNLPPNFHKMPLAEQIDYRMKEMMSKFESSTCYQTDSTDTSSDEGSVIFSKGRKQVFTELQTSFSNVSNEKSNSNATVCEAQGEDDKSSEDLEMCNISQNSSKVIRHITADSVLLSEIETPMDINNLKCTYCRLDKDPLCFACGLEVSNRGSTIRQKCSYYRCGKFYHLHCLKMWPQTQWSIGKWSKNNETEDSFTCPAHTCHTCFSDELGSACCRLPGEKLARCMLCPAAFHTTTFCVPAGTDILGGSQIICPRHRSKPTQPINTIWCFICSQGGNLVCCDTCPTSVHPECQPVSLTDDDKYICEDCESGRFPLYDEVVWVKLGQYRWWPALILFPNEIPENVRAIKHQRGDFVVRFFGTNDHYWVNKSRSFLFQEGDRGGSPGEINKSKNKVYESFGKAIEEAAVAYKHKKEFKLRREAESISNLKPPSYIKINKNKPVGNVKMIELDLSNATACECDPNKPHPCGPDSDCINRLLMTECDPDVCLAGSRCRNQTFQKKEYPPMIPYKTQGRGWGLKCLAPIKKGQFIIEYVGELIDSEEYQRRIQKMHEQKEENYYFMTVDSDRVIDAGPKGNISRFMNHSCKPNCVTQKWTIRGDTRVGLFAKCDIEAGSELTFNYNLEVVGQEKKVCKCGAVNCSGFIGVKVKTDKSERLLTDTTQDLKNANGRQRKFIKKRPITPPILPPCFLCGRKQSDLTCNNKACNKGYHLKCLKLEETPEALKFICPRHNCNICSNRTIRCCVKCTNSFCPSHSDGKVRHDKFLGFVCWLHDSGPSSTENISEISQKSCVKFKSKKCLAPKGEETIGVKLQYGLRRKNEKLELRQNETDYICSAGEIKKRIKGKMKINKPYVAVKRKLHKVKSRKIILSSEMPIKNRKLAKENKPNYAYMKYVKLKSSINNFTNEEREIIRAKWREHQRTFRLKKLMKKINNKVDDAKIIEEIKTNARDDLENLAVVHHKNQNSIITHNERSEFEYVKLNKRRRLPKPSSDEAAVSSTTSDEDIILKTADQKKASQTEDENTPSKEVDRQDFVTSSPMKKSESSLHSSEDELNLDERVKRLSASRKKRKKNMS